MFKRSGSTFDEDSARGAPRAWLVDVYDTVLSARPAAPSSGGCRPGRGLPLRFMAASRAEDGGAMVSPTGIADAVAADPRALRGRPGRRARRRARRGVPVLMREHCTVHEDAVDFLHRLRAAGVPDRLRQQLRRGHPPAARRPRPRPPRRRPRPVLRATRPPSRPRRIYAHALAELDVPAGARGHARRPGSATARARWTQVCPPSASSAPAARPRRHAGPSPPAPRAAHPAHMPVVATCAALAP